jgi:hypothetical protein
MATSFQSKHPGAYALGQSIFELAQGCYAYEALLLVTSDPNVQIIVPDVPVGEGPQGKLIRKDGSSHNFDMRYYLNLSKGLNFINDHIVRSWCSGALITAGDLLEKEDYFDHQPEFELLYHLRNAIAHGNAFNIKPSGKKRLKSHNAYLRWYDNSERFRISENMHENSVLFDFIELGDVADILTLTAERLKDLERGILGPGVATSIFG